MRVFNDSTSFNNTARIANLPFTMGDMNGTGVLKRNYKKLFRKTVALNKNSSFTLIQKTDQLRIRLYIHFSSEDDYFEL